MADARGPADGMRGELRGLRRVRWQMTAWYVVTLCVILTVLGGGLFEILSRQLQTQLDASLGDATHSLARAAATIELEPGDDAREDVARSGVVRIPDRDWYVLREDGTPLAPDTASAWVRDEARTAARSGTIVDDHEMENDRTERVRAERFYARDGTLLIAVVAADRVEWEDQNGVARGDFRRSGCLRRPPGRDWRVRAGSPVDGTDRGDLRVHAAVHG